MIVKTKHLYKILYDLPKVPEKFLNINIESTKENTVFQVPHYDIQNRPDNESKSSIVKGYWVIDELEKWKDDHIGYAGRKLMCREVIVEPQSSFYLPHVDLNRKFVALYNLIDSGGKLCFWHEDDMELYREPFLCTNYNKLKLVDYVEIPPYTWYVVNSQVLHSVENLSGHRKNIQFKLKQTDPLVVENLIPL
jgi:hypothetical protein